MYRVALYCLVIQSFQYVIQTGAGMYNTTFTKHSVIINSLNNTIWIGITAALSTNIFSEL